MRFSTVIRLSMIFIHVKAVFHRAKTFKAHLKFTLKDRKNIFSKKNFHEKGKSVRKIRRKFPCENISTPKSINYRDFFVHDSRELLSVDKYYFKKHMKKACLLALSSLHLVTFCCEKVLTQDSRVGRTQIKYLQRDNHKPNLHIFHKLKASCKHARHENYNNATI